MSITCKIFRIPRTLDEFVDKVKRYGDKQVDITLRTYTKVNYKRLLINYRCIVDVQARKIKLRLYEHPMQLGLGIYFAPEKIADVDEIEQTSLNETVETAKKLKGFGLEVTINKKPIDTVLEAINRGDKFYKIADVDYLKADKN